MAGELKNGFQTTVETSGRPLEEVVAKGTGGDGKATVTSRRRVDLCHKRLDNVESIIEAYIDPHGDLVIHGQDMGSVVEEYFGKADYEYWRSVPHHEKNAALEALQAITAPERIKQLLVLDKHPDNLLLYLVKEHFSSDMAISNFEEWCNTHGITYTCHSF